MLKKFVLQALGCNEQCPCFLDKAAHAQRSENIDGIVCDVAV